MFNLDDLTRGNYRVRRTVTYPDFPGSRVNFEADVKATGNEWTTSLNVTGTYDAPTDVVGVSEYRLTWQAKGAVLQEEGEATLRLASGGTLRSRWTSEITPAANRLARFPKEGQTIDVSFSPFEIDGSRLRYEWQGTVRRGDGRQTTQQQTR